MNEKLSDEVAKFDWMHSIDLGDGIVTPGKWPRNPHIAAAFDRIDFGGKKVLDIGTCNGLWSFEAEKRGASEIYSVDYLTHDNYWCTPAYQFAHEALGSKARYMPDLSAYDIESLGRNEFDVVVFCGIYYHLKHPLLALSKVRKVLKTGGLVIIEGPVIANESEAMAGFLYRGNQSKDDYFGRWDNSNWWVPSVRCLAEWVECSFFDVLEEFSVAKHISQNGGLSRLKAAVRSRLVDRRPTYRRTVLLAKAVTRPDQFYSSKQADQDLVDFFE
jgi:tRNA (mo5U34)-methyltransferase